MNKNIRIDIEMVGPVASHNLICWVCNKRKAVYHMNPTWCFGPCWQCDSQLNGKLHRVKSKLLSRLLS